MHSCSGGRKVMKAYMRQYFRIGCWLVLAICVSFIGINIVDADKVKAAEPDRITFYGAVTSSISSSVAVPAAQAYLWTSGTVPPVINPDATAGTRDRYGDTKTQAIGIIKQLDTVLQQGGLSLADVIYLRAYLVADPALNNQVDFQGWFDAYAQFFNTRVTPKTARSTVAVTRLVDPGWLIEVEAFAIYPKNNK